jgi:hypothetical protein
VPSKERPPYGGLRRAPLLDAQVEIAVAVGDHTTARLAADELCEIADTFDSLALHAIAELAQGRVALAEGDPAGAVPRCEHAVAMWVEIGAPFEAAVARTVLADARDRTGNRDGAAMDRQAAERGFYSYGARSWAQRVGESSPPSPKPRRPEPSVSSVPSGGGSNVFRCDGDTRTICFDGVTVLLHDLKGLRYLERLLAEPNREFHVLDLVAIERGSLPTTPNTDDSDLTTSDGGHAGFHLDDQAREAYRRRLVDIDDDIEDATLANDLPRLELAHHDREYLIRELSRAVGLGGRGRHAGDTAERARTSVTRAIRYASARITEHHPTLGQHLHHAISTGTYCSYEPDPRMPVVWITSPVVERGTDSVEP